MEDERKNCIAFIKGRKYRCALQLAFYFEGDRYSALELPARLGGGMMIALCRKPFQADEHYVQVSYSMQLKLADFLSNQ